MPYSGSASRYGRNKYLLKNVRNIIALFVIISAFFFSIFIITRSRSGLSNEKKELIRLWNEGDYESAYNITRNALINKPIDYFFLTMHGFASYQLGISQINNQNILSFIDECIFSLRKAMIIPSAKNDGRLYYVLGKAYGYKGKEYSDLAIKYLSKAEQLSYLASDISEYLGIAYAASGDYRKSVEAFAVSLRQTENPSDNLLLPIARSYMAMDENLIARGYLTRCIASSPDSKSIILARILLAEIYMKNSDYDSAEEQYNIILNEGGVNAEAHFQLGELYNLKGDTVRARSEWRNAVRQDPNHAGARSRLNI